MFKVRVRVQVYSSGVGLDFVFISISVLGLGFEVEYMFVCGLTVEECRFKSSQVLWVWIMGLGSVSGYRVQVTPFCYSV